MASYGLYTGMGDIQQYVGDGARNYSQNFRSILLDEWDNMRPMKMGVTIRNYENVLVVRVYKDAKTISWFAKALDRCLSMEHWTLLAFMAFILKIF